MLAPRIQLSLELSYRCPVEEIHRHSDLAEEAEFHRIWVPDTVVSPWDAWLAASLIVQNTKRLRVGVGVTNPFTRHPVVMAQMACMLQTLSRGRLSLCLGKGLSSFLKKLGIHPEDEGVEEGVAILRRLISGERCHFQGRVFQVDGLRLKAAPPPFIPIYLAATGPAGWERGIRLGDGLSVFWEEGLGEKMRSLLSEPRLPVAVLIPFSVSLPDFFPNQVTQIEVLVDRIRALEEQRVDEVIVAYGDFIDLKRITDCLSPHRGNEKD